MFENAGAFYCRGLYIEPERFIVVTNWFEELRQRMGN